MLTRFLKVYLTALLVLVFGVSALSVVAPKITLVLGTQAAEPNSFFYGFEAALKGFRQRYPDIDVKANYGYGADRCIVAIAGGTPVDVYMVDGPWVSSWALKGLLQPLDSFIRGSDVDPKDFPTPAWRQCVWRDKVWAVAVQIDPNFALIWNQDLFDEAGLDPKVGPKTLPEFNEYFSKLTRTDSSGKMKQIGMVPWNVFGYANTMYTWGWIFGGDFCDYQKERATAHDSNNVDALTYLRDLYLRYNVDVSALGSGLPTGSDLFSGGRQAMFFAHSAWYSNYRKRFPDMRIGIGQMPYRPGIKANPAWIGGWTLAIPTGVKHPEAAWKLLHYLTCDPEGTTLFATGSGDFPACLKSPIYTQYAKTPDKAIFMKIAMEASHQRPVIPVQEFYSAELDRALANVFAGKIQPREALKYVSERADAELAKALSNADGGAKPR